MQVEEHFGVYVKFIMGYFKGIVTMCEAYTWIGEDC